MRSIGFTLLLALVASAAIGLATFQWKEGNFDRIFGQPAVAVGETLYHDFKPEQVARIEVRSGKLEGVFEKEDQHWQALTPWKDRMDPMAADAIIRFTLGMQVEDHSPADKVELPQAGLGRKAVQLRLIDAKGEVLAHYRLGRVSSWKAEIEGAEKQVDTVFIQPKGELGDEHIYLCAGNISPLFQENFKLLRDHQPLYFNALNLETVSIRSQQGEITLGHNRANLSWRIIKPLNLPTDPDAIKSLIQGLTTLRATRVRDRSEVTLPTSNTAADTTIISLKRIGQDKPTTLEIYPPETLEDTSLKAVVSNRPNTVFELPAKPTPGMVSLADLPLDVNALRDTTLTRINLDILKAIAIEPSTGPKILIEAGSGRPPRATINGRTFPANQQNLEKLLYAVATSRVSGFESDAATDFSPWGLDRPILKLRFLAIDNQVIELRFGMNQNGETFVNRTGTPIVMKVDKALIQAITVEPYEWKHSRLWSINRADLSELTITKPNAEPLVLTYTFLAADDQWQAKRGGKDLTPKLVSAHANYLLSQLEGINVERWLSKTHVDALSALSNPSLSITAMERIEDEQGDLAGTRTRTLILAPAPAPKYHGSHFGMLLGDSHPFLIDSALYRKLAAQLIED